MTDPIQETTDKRQQAMKLFQSGYNCAQAVFVAFLDETGLDKDVALRLSSSFGGGIGRLREVCGAVSGMAMATGMLYGNTNPEDQDAKADHYAFIQALAEAFKQENGSYICRELLALPDGPDVPVPEPRTPAYYRLRPCAEYVGYAAALLQEAIDKREHS